MIDNNPYHYISLHQLHGGDDFSLLAKAFQAFLSQLLWRGLRILVVTFLPSGDAEI